MAQPPWNYRGTLEKNLKGSPFALFLYDALYFYAVLMDRMLNSSINPRNGTAMFEMARDSETRFDGKSGRVHMDTNNDRIGDYVIFSLQTDKPEYTPMLHIRMTAEGTDRMKPVADWGILGVKTPVDTPPCGFYNEFCPGDNT
ncbi:hypothetical protein CAPTEDRAFT_189851, partial [Capitella teleta]